LRLEHLEQPAHLALVALDGVRQVLGRISIEHVGLAHHGPYTAHLKHEPLNDARAALCVRREKRARLFREIDHESARLEYDEVVIVVIDNRGNLAVRVDAQIPRLLLLLGIERDLAHPIRQTELLERDGRFPPVGRGGGEELDHDANSA
jgi:hypothetical protein